MRDLKVFLAIIICFSLIFLSSCEKELVPGLKIIDCDKFQYLGKEYIIEDADEYGNDKMIITVPVITIFSVEEMVEKTLISEYNDTITFEITFLDGCIEYVKPK